MKYLFRWTVGNINSAGLQCLRQCINNIKKLYPEADRVVCYNQINTELIKDLDAELVDQNNYLDSFPIKPALGVNVHWKLYPVRLNLDIHEICLDNDIIIFDRIPEIDLFLKDEVVLLYQGLNGFHGRYKDLIPKGIRFNSGIFGLPPKFDFVSIAKSIVLPDWLDYFDEQGLVGSVLLSVGSYYMIPLTTLPIIQSEFDLNKIMGNKLCKGLHFCGLNRKEFHLAWNNYLKLFLDV